MLVDRWYDFRDAAGSRSGRQGFVLHPWELGRCLKLLCCCKSPRRVEASLGSTDAVCFFLSAFEARRYVELDGIWLSFRHEKFNNTKCYMLAGHQPGTSNRYVSARCLSLEIPLTATLRLGEALSGIGQCIVRQHTRII